MGTKKIGLTLLVILLSSSSIVFAQGYVESALLFSRTRPWGSARIQGLGGAQIALGGDYSSSLSNPAGLGMYNRSEVTLSTGLSFYNTDANYKNNSTSESTSKLNIPGLSLVYNIPSERESDFVSGSIAISMSRVNDFNRSIRYQGVNTISSIADSFIDNAWGSTTAQFDTDAFNYNTPTGLAYFNYLIGPTTVVDPDAPDDEYFSDVNNPDDETLPPFSALQKEEIENKGSASQWNFAYGTNYKDILFLGAGVGITSLKYRSQKTYSEEYDGDGPINNMVLNENLSMSGTGVNLTLGAIVRPVRFFQFGVSFTTPTYIAISERYNASMSTSWNDFDYYGDGSEILGDNTGNPITLDEVVSDYALTTPLKVSAGIAFISKYGLITADIESSNPGRAKYSSSQGLSFGEENDLIRSSFKKALTYRVGIEGKIDIFRIRAGYSLQGNTLDNSIGFNNKVQTISGGIGIRKSKFSVDFALASSSYDSFYNPYLTYETPVVELKNKVTNGVVTVGFFF